MGWRLVTTIVFVTFFSFAFAAKPKQLARDYVPGKVLTFKKFKSYENRWFKAYQASKGVSPVLLEWTKDLDKELRPALLKALTDKRTRFFLGSFNDPAERKTGRYRSTYDDGAGMRVIGQLELGTKEHPRVILIITFWTYDEKLKRLRLLGGPDSVRVLSEIEDGEYAGLSYHLTLDQKGKVAGLRPGIYMNDKGGFIYPGVEEAANPDHCNVCHGKPKKDEWKHVTQPYDTWDGHDDFIDYVSEKGASPKKVKRVKRKLTSLRALLFSTKLLKAVKKDFPSVHGR